ncbi:hypothetical protein MKW94_003880 [Papaver nudicaule]|uniref:Uncharacterized protein n=1 Tax=Papaver nudicaule TaxID=74823 RepID=A0AA41SC57_PAPNU|nr:hypothetical protein [Papaver nudicaule]
MDSLISFDLKLIPYGNARIDDDKVITCQHGPNECVLNRVEACALQVWPALDKHFNFIKCVETFVYNSQQSEWKSCYSKLGYEEEPINECYNNGLGQQEYYNFQTYVCNAYKGTKPAACQGQQMDVIPEAKSNQMLEVTFVGETTPTTKIMSPTTKASRQMKF